MYLVVSHWKAIPGHEDEFETIGHKVRAIMSAQPGTLFFEAFKFDGKHVVIHGYTDEVSYNSLVNDPNGPFANAIADLKLEDHATWLGSERGTAIPH
jgi:hypothetical protein